MQFPARLHVIPEMQTSDLASARVLLTLVMMCVLLFQLLVCVRGHPSISLLPLLSPTPPLSICIPHPHLCTISKDHTYSRRLSGPTVQ
jgi:hypothetical protein